MVDVSTNFVGKTDVILNKLEQFIWPAATSVDSTTKTHFVFKAFPISIKSSQINDWARLQIKTLTPFPSGDTYYYISKQGLHAWFSLSALHGIPESAYQSSMGDGTHIVKGNSFCYEQEWQNGVLIKCLTLPSDLDGAHKITTAQPWAIDSKLKESLTKPLVWLGITSFVFALCLLFLSAAYVTVTLQSKNAATQTESLQSELGEKLNTVTQLRERQTALESILQWNQINGSLPNTLAQTIEGVLLQSQWKATSIVWQNKTLTVELVTNNIDIAELVGHLEQQDVVGNVVIRPALQANTWVLEVTAI